MLTGYLDTIVSTKGATTLQDLDYTFDVLGNLTQREDKFQDLVEDFQYDNLNRVVDVDTKLSGTTFSNVTMTYDVLGNITNKSDVGTYTYWPGASCLFIGPCGPACVDGSRRHQERDLLL